MNVAKNISAVIALLCCSSYLQAQQSIKGLVYEDRNNNQIKEQGEKGLAGVPVSNGVEVVLTNETGAYELPLTTDNIIFVVKPSGYTLPLNVYNFPRNYYIHKPGGSPSGLKYTGTPPTGAPPESLDFGLTPQQENDEFTALIFGDPQPYTLEEIAYFDKGIIEEARQQQQIAFGISLGDLVGDHLELHQPYSEAIKRMNMPWYQVIGNHDMNYDAQEDKYSDETFEQNFGPANYAFNYGKAHFIVLDDILYPDPRDGKGYWGGFRPDQLAFIKNDLQHVPKEQLIVLNFHIPLLIKEQEEFIRQDRQALFDLLEGYEHVLAFSAHTHLQRHNFYTQADGWRNINPLHEINIGTTSGDWYSGPMNPQGVPSSTMRDGTPKGYGLLQVQGSQYKLQYKVAGQPADYQIKVFNPKVLKKDQRTSAHIFANFFVGYRNDKLQYRVDSGTWKQMDYVEAVDPDYQVRLLQYDLSATLLEGRRSSNPEPCTHLWHSTIPTGLAVGTHTIDIKATDLFGQTYTQTSSYKIVE